MHKRQTVTLELDSDAVQAAQAKGLDLATVLWEALYRKIPTLHAEERAEQARRWLEENKEAIESHNRRVESDGFVFSDGARTF
jgi:post-segregation antitoxin (ccd killing protein)